ncbi:hypothetical protein [Xanthomonas citri]|uniref:hypothetical protein n=1 Tax=Xanthomonas citri TaxID=346 RepID=UPI000C40D176|nr:hypothetical protein [Xanthomonas citri]SOO08796.1 exported hypothetical protein [Xanthomonas citri pv. fuscans]
MTKAPQQKKFDRDALVISAIAFAFGSLFSWALIDPPMVKLASEAATAPVEKSDIPAWVQAVGSVLAIFVAIIVPVRLQQQTKMEKAAEAKAKARSLAVDLLDEMTDLAGSMQTLQADGYRTLGDAYGYDAALRRVAIPPALKQSAKQLHELGPAGTTLQLALLEISFLRGKLMECGLKREGTRNNLAVSEAKRSLDDAVQLLHKASQQLGDLFDDV